MLKNKKFILFISFIILTLNLHGQNYKDSLDARLSQLSSELELPGFTAIIVNKEGTLYQKSMGYADIQNQKPFTVNTIQNIGSVSKTFIAVALMKAVELGYFELDSDINDIISVKVINPYFPDEKIKVRHLATHTSGIIDNDSIYHRSYRFYHTEDTDKELLSFMNKLGYSGGIQDTTLQSFLSSYLSKEGKLYRAKNFYQSKPGERYSYSNIGSALAAYLIEESAGMSFADFSEKFILKPLKMNEASWFFKDIDRSEHAIPYYNKETAFPFYSLITYPDGGLRTSGKDLSKYVCEMIRALNGDSDLLQSASFKEMFTPNFDAENVPDNMSLETRNKGVFWNIYTDGFIGHDGDDPGVSTNILFNREVGIIFMTNIYLDDRTELLNVLKKYADQLN